MAIVGLIHEEDMSEWGHEVNQNGPGHKVNKNRPGDEVNEDNLTHKGKRRGLIKRARRTNPTTMNGRTMR